MNFKQVCIQIKLMWIGIAALGVFCGYHQFIVGE